MSDEGKEWMVADGRQCHGVDGEVRILRESIVTDVVAIEHCEDVHIAVAPMAVTCLDAAA